MDAFDDSRCVSYVYCNDKETGFSYYKKIISKQENNEQKDYNSYKSTKNCLGKG